MKRRGSRKITKEMRSKEINKNCMREMKKE